MVCEGNYSITQNNNLGNSSKQNSYDFFGFRLIWRINLFVESISNDNLKVSLSVNHITHSVGTFSPFILSFSYYELYSYL